MIVQVNRLSEGALCRFQQKGTLFLKQVARLV